MDKSEQEKLARIISEEEKKIDPDPKTVFGQGKTFGVVTALERIKQRITVELDVEFPQTH